MTLIKVLAIYLILRLWMGIDLSNSTLKSPKPFPLLSIANLIKNLYGGELPEVEEIKEDSSLTINQIKFHLFSRKWLSAIIRLIRGY